MAHINDGKVVLDHTGQQIDDNIDEVVDARGEYSSLAESIASSSGGSYTETDLISSPLVGNISTIQLSDSMQNYDYLVFLFGVTVDNQWQAFTQTVSVSDLNTSSLLFLQGFGNTTYNMYYLISRSTDTVLNVDAKEIHGWGESQTIFRIKGVKC